MKQKIFDGENYEYNGVTGLLLDDGRIITKWKPSFIERLKILFSGYIWVVLSRNNVPMEIRLDCPFEAEVMQNESDN